MYMITTAYQEKATKANHELTTHNKAHELPLLAITKK